MPKQRRPVIDEDVHSQLRRAVRESPFSTTWLAQQLGRDRTTIYKWLDGTNAIPPQMLERFCTLLDLPPEQRVAQFAGRGYPLPQQQAERAHHLRAPVRDFVGRDDEVYQIVAALRDAPQGAIAAISGVRGMGGVGKTELAFMAAQRLAPLFPDGQVVIALHGAGATPLSPEHTLQAVLRAVDPQAKHPEDLDTLQKRYRSQLHGKRVLVIADDAHDATQVQPLLPPPGCALLITSRQRFVLPGMVSVDLGALPQADAEQLLRTICPRIGAAATRLAQLCAGLPLALRISASLLAGNDAYPVERYLNQLAAERMKYLRDPHEPDNPQASVEAALALSYGALTPAVREALCRLSVFIGDFDRTAALAVLADDEEGDAALLHLRWRSLLEWDAVRQRYKLHDLVQAFAADRLSDPHIIQQRYAEHFMRRAEQVDADPDSPPSRRWLEAVDVEMAHLRTAFDWLSQHEPGERPLRLAVALGPFWLARDAIREGGRWIETALQHAPITHNDAVVQLRAQGLLLLGELSRMQGRLEVAQSYLEQSGALWLHELEDESAYADVLFNLGILASDLNDHLTAETYYKQSLARFQHDHRLLRAGAALVNLGRGAKQRGNGADAERFYEEAAATMRVTGDREQLGWLLLNLTALRSEQGAYEVALRDIDDSLAQFEAIGHRNGLAWASYVKGALLADHGRYADARALVEHNMNAFAEVASAMGIAMSHKKLVSVALAQNDTQQAWKHAVLCLQCYQEIRQEVGLSLGIEYIAMLVAERDALVAARLLGCAEVRLTALKVQRDAIDQALYAHTLSTLRAQLGETAFMTVWEEGRALPLDEAVQLALRADGS